MLTSAQFVLILDFNPLSWQDLPQEPNLIFLESTAADPVAPRSLAALSRPIMITHCFCLSRHLVLAEPRYFPRFYLESTQDSHYQLF